MKAEDKHIEELINNMMKDVEMESPSADFTHMVMAQIDADKQSNTIRYKPLISKHVWLIIGCAILGTCAYLLLNTSNYESSWLNRLDLGQFTNNSITQTLSGFTLPKTVMYTVLGFALMICVQVPLLKHYFNKRLEF